MAAKAVQLEDIRRRTDINGHVHPAPPSDAEMQRRALQGGLDLALEAGDAEAAEIFASAIAKSAAAEGRPAGAAEDGPTVSADQGARPQPPGPPSLAEALAAAEAAGDVRECIRIKGLQHDINRRRADHDDSRGLFR